MHFTLLFGRKRPPEACHIEGVSGKTDGVSYRLYSNSGSPPNENGANKRDVNRYGFVPDAAYMTLIYLFRQVTGFD